MWARRRASAGSSPSRISFAVSCSMWNASSSLSASSAEAGRTSAPRRLRHRFIHVMESDLLFRSCPVSRLHSSRRAQHHLNKRHVALPLLLFGAERAPPGGGELVVL